MYTKSSVRPKLRACAREGVSGSGQLRTSPAQHLSGVSGDLELAVEVNQADTKA
jgi:hypothetical protein